MCLYEKHPLLIALNVERTIFRGFIQIKDKEYQLKLELMKEGVVKGAKVLCDWPLKHLLRHHQHLIEQRLEQSPDLASFLQELQAIVERQLPKNEVKTKVGLSNRYSQVIEDIEQLGCDRLLHVDESFRDLHFRCEDAAGREHVLKLQLDAKHPDIGPKCQTDTPFKFAPIWDSKVAFQGLCEQFERALLQCQALWDQLDDLDEHTWVLEPENPTRRALYRRLALGNNASLHLTVDAAHPHALPECQLLGAEHVTNPLRENLNRNLDKWDESQKLLHNLETVFETKFPSPSNTKKEDMTLACGICYAYRLGASLPEEVCEDPRCAQPFHQTCLYEWLRGLTTSRQSFNVVFGECPYCSKPITVKMPTT